MKVAKLELYLTSLASLQRSAKSKCRIEGISVTKSILHPFLLSFLPLPDVLCDPTYLIWRKGTPFEAMTGLTAPSSDGLLAKVSSAIRQKPEDLRTAPRIISLSPLSLATDVTEATHGASGLRLGTRTGAAGTATLGLSFFWPKPIAP